MGTIFKMASAEGKIIKRQMTYYHGSHIKLPPGFILTGRGSDYEISWSNTDFYQILEKYRPEDKIAHKEAVFMCGNDDDIDCAGGGTEWVFTLRADGPVEKHDINWTSSISCALSENAEEKDIRELAYNYWSGVPSEDPLWEHLTRQATIISCEEF